jgi:hypothetical protein
MVGLAAVHPVQARELGESRVAGVDEHGRPAGVGDADGRGCRDEVRSAAGARWWGSGEGWRGLVWCTSGLPAGISRCAGLLLVGWRAATLSRSCHKRRETRWDGGRYVETISAGRRDGGDGLGRVNMVSR